MIRSDQPKAMISAEETYRGLLGTEQGSYAYAGEYLNLTTGIYCEPNLHIFGSQNMDSASARRPIVEAP